MNVVQVAELCQTINRVYCTQIGDWSNPSWNETDDASRESIISAIQFVLSGLRKGVHVAAWDVHSAWVGYKIAAGWTHGDVRDEKAKTHPLIVPFDKLSKEEQRKDYLFIAIVEGCYRAGIDE